MYECGLIFSFKLQFSYLKSIRFYIKQIHRKILLHFSRRKTFVALGEVCVCGGRLVLGCCVWVGFTCPGIFLPPVVLFGNFRYYLWVIRFILFTLFYHSNCFGILRSSTKNQKSCVAGVSYPHPLKYKYPSGKTSHCATSSCILPEQKIKGKICIAGLSPGLRGKYKKQKFPLQYFLSASGKIKNLKNTG